MSIYRPRFINEWRDIKREGGYKLLLKKKRVASYCGFFPLLSHPRFNPLYHHSLSWIYIPERLFLSAFLFCGASPASPIQFNSLTSDVRGCQIRTAMD